MKYTETIGNVSKTYEGTAEEIVDLINQLEFSGVTARESLPITIETEKE